MSLLPPNATPLERALFKASEPDVNPTPLSWLADASRCPVSFLPWLAWERSVDGWDEALTEGPRRTLISRSIEIHKHKGTAGAVRRALGALGVSVEFKEWQDIPGAAPFTFGLTAWVNENHDGHDGALLTPALYERLKRMVDAVKNERSHYRFKVGARFDQSPFLLANAHQARAVARGSATALAVQPKTLRQPVALASAAQLRAVCHHAATVSMTLSTQSGLALASASRARAVLHVTMEAR
jgi:phage tail P2-like protein